MYFSICGFNFRALACEKLVTEMVTFVLYTWAKPIVTLEMETSVRGFHVYKAIWGEDVREELECRRERGNQVDRYAVAVVKDETVGSHVATTKDFMDMLTVCKEW